MATTVPQPTFGPRGFVAPTQPSVLAGFQADINAAFGGGLNPALETPQGQLATSEASVMGNVNDLFVNLTNQVDPAYAEGRMQDAIGRIYFMSRTPAEPTVLEVACSGLQGVIIPIGARIQDTSSNIYTCTGTGTIPAGGSVTVSFECNDAGPIPVPGANDVSIYQAIPGWDAVAVVSGVIGNSTESRQAFEERRADTVAGNSFGAAGSIVGAVARVTNVLDYYAYSNNSAAPVTISGVTIPANAVYVAVAGGADQDVAQAILSKKGGGAPMAGDTTVTTYDDNPLYVAPVPYDITFQRPTALQILFDVTIVSGPHVPSDAAQQIQAALIAAFAGNFEGLRKARIGSVLYAVSYVAPIAALGSWAQVAAITIGSANTPSAQFVGHINSSTLTVTALTSGALAAGQELSDLNGLIAVGTVVVAQLTGAAGGIGTYTVNNPQTVAGAQATCSGTGAGPSLTLTSVTGTISVGDVVSGTGAPAGTVIVSQLSGTAGGAGVYEVNQATTAAGHVLNFNAPMKGSLADQDLVPVQIDQIPQLSAVNIAVSLT